LGCLPFDGIFKIHTIEARIMNAEFKIGEWLVQPSLNTFSGEHATIRVEPKVMEVIVYLAGHAGEVVSKEHIIKSVWADRFVTDEVLTTAICELRKALGDEAKRPRFIQTIPKKGYRLIAPVVIEELDSPDAGRASAIRPQKEFESVLPEPKSGYGWRTITTAGVAALLLAALFTLKADVWKAGKLGETSINNIKSLAVMPLKNLSNDPEQDYFADGMTEALITDLARLGSLRVISRTSVMQYKKGDKAVPEIARELNVEAIVEGSVLRAGDRVRVTAQLINAANDHHLWAETYERDIRDMLTLQNEIAQAIAQGIEMSIAIQSRAYRSGTSSVSPEAYQTYLKGLQFTDNKTAESLKRALEHFERATEIDSNYAPAYGAQSETYILLLGCNELRPDEAYLKAKTAALRALQIDDSVAEAHNSMAAVKLFYDLDWAGAESEFKRAIELNPSYARAHLWYGEYLWAAVRMEEATTEIKRAQELDPMSLETHMLAGNLFFTLQRYDEAIEGYRKAIAVDFNNALAHKGLGHCYDKKSMREESEAEYKKYSELSGPPRLEQIPPALSKWVKRNDTRSIIYAFSKVLNHKYVRATHLARIYLELGEKETAFKWLEKAYEERDSRLLYLKTDNGWDSLRTDSRFIEIVRRLGMIP
jgi:TolB-like protein/DNA-binding winged helix-turn-helix (wHTH) protein/Tfp pilus assembly protein PilF